MIEQIQLNNMNNGSVNKLGDNNQAKNTYNHKNQTQFKGLGGALLRAVQAGEQIPMLNVTVLD